MTEEEIFCSAQDLEGVEEDELSIDESDLFHEPPQWVIEKLMKKTHPNYSLLFLHTLFRDKIELSSYDLVSSGVDRANKKVFHTFRILSTADTVLIGAHTVQFRGKIFNVSSLRALKKHFFGFDDVTSFERSTFLIHHSKRLLIRLKNIRPLLTCKICSVESAFSSPSKELAVVQKKQKERKVTSFIIQKHIDPIITFYHKQNPHLDMLEIIDRTQLEIYLFLNNEKFQYQNMQNPETSFATSA